MRTRVLIAFLSLLPSLALAAPQGMNAKASEEDKLFAELKKADSPDAAKPIEEKIGGIFRASGSASVDLLMVRVGTALGQADNSHRPHPGRSHHPCRARLCRRLADARPYAARCQ